MEDFRKRQSYKTHVDAGSDENKNDPESMMPENKNN